MAVRTTATVGDALAQRKKILAEVTELTQKRDTAEREYRLWADALTAVKAELKAKGLTTIGSDEINKLVAEKLQQTRKELQDDVRTLEGDREKKKAELKGLAEHSDRIGKEIDAKKTQKLVLEGDITEKKNWYRGEHSTNTRRIVLKQKELAETETKLKEALQRIGDIERKEAELTELRLSEETRLATKGRDLAIYEARIRKAAAQVGIEINL